MKKSVAFYIHSHENPIRFNGVLKEFEKIGRKDVYRIHDLDEEEKKRDERARCWRYGRTRRRKRSKKKI